MTNIGSTPPAFPRDKPSYPPFRSYAYDMTSRKTYPKAYPNGQCYCGCGAVLQDRTAFWVRGHDAEAAHRVIREQYGNVADFVQAHQDEGDSPAIEKVRRLEQLVFPQGREHGPIFRHSRTTEEWGEMRQLVHDMPALPIYAPGAWSVLQLAAGLLAEYDKYKSQ